MNKDICLIPFVCGAGAGIAGCEHGPGVLYDLGLSDALSNRERHVSWDDNPHHLYKTQEHYYRNLPRLGTPERQRIVVENCRYIADRVEAVVKDGALPVTIGGDHSIAAGSMAGFAKAKSAHGRIGVIWVDAHADINTCRTSTSQAYHGMPLAALLGRGDPEFAHIGGRDPVLQPQNIAYIGLRDVDPAEVDVIKELGIRAYDIEDVQRRGALAVFEEALVHIGQSSDYLVLSIDLDAFDPELAPAVGTPVAAGLRRKEMLLVYRRLSKNHKIDMIELVELNPTLKGAEETAILAMNVLKILL